MTAFGPLTDQAATPFLPTSGFTEVAVAEIATELRSLLADTIALYMKTKSFHWHMSGPHFREYHLLLDEQAGQVFDAIDIIAERARKIGASSLRSIEDVAKHKRLPESQRTDLTPSEMLDELRTDNQRYTEFLRHAHHVCERHRDIATASLLEVWIDQSEGRSWFLAASAAVHA